MILKKFPNRDNKKEETEEVALKKIFMYFKYLSTFHTTKMFMCNYYSKHLESNCQIHKLTVFHILSIKLLSFPQKAGMF